MIIRQLYESDGRCFARIGNSCSVYGGEPDAKVCGTYQCKWYKPKDCKDWTKLEVNHMVKLFPPEEIRNGKDQQ